MNNLKFKNKMFCFSQNCLIQKKKKKMLSNQGIERQNFAKQK